jgi:hypothetical protein
MQANTQPLDLERLAAAKWVIEKHSDPYKVIQAQSLFIRTRVESGCFLRARPGFPKEA